MRKLKIAFFGSSLVSAYWNGAATYYRGIIKALNDRGHQITFFEPDAYNRQAHRDLPEVAWAESVVYKPTLEGLKKVLDRTPEFDVLIKTSGIGVQDEVLEEYVPDLKLPNQVSVFWDVDAPATLEAAKADVEKKFISRIQKFDMVFTYGGGDKVVETYYSLGAKFCCPIYNAVDPETHFRVAPELRFKAELAFLGNRLPDREARVADFFLHPAEQLKDSKFIIGGNGWDAAQFPENVQILGHVYTKDHNALNSTVKAVLNISRDDMASYGFSPATRVFEAAAAGACIITDEWLGIETFFKPGKEILVAENGEAVKKILGELSHRDAEAIGDAARKRALKEHTYEIRAAQAEKLLLDQFN